MKHTESDKIDKIKQVITYSFKWYNCNLYNKNIHNTRHKSKLGHHQYQE